MPRKTRNGLPPPRKRPEKFASERDEQDDTLRVLREVDLERKQHGNQQSARIGDDRKKVDQARHCSTFFLSSPMRADCWLPCCLRSRSTSRRTLKVSSSSSRSLVNFFPPLRGGSNPVALQPFVSGSRNGLGGDQS